MTSLTPNTLFAHARMQRAHTHTHTHTHHTHTHKITTTIIHIIIFSKTNVIFHVYSVWDGTLFQILFIKPMKGRTLLRVIYVMRYQKVLHDRAQLVLTTFYVMCFPLLLQNIVQCKSLVGRSSHVHINEGISIYQSMKDQSCLYRELQAAWLL